MQICENIAWITDSDIEELQHSLATVDQCIRRTESSGFAELIILKLNHTKLTIRPEQNHGRAHFHIEFKKEYAASYAVDTLECLAGRMPQKYEKPILNWAQDKQKHLMSTWEALVAGKDVRELVIAKE